MWQPNSLSSIIASLGRVEAKPLLWLVGLNCVKAALNRQSISAAFILSIPVS